MIEFERFQLENGLRVIFHSDPTTPIAVVNTLFDVGAKDENPDRTGFAHLFEHLMFGGSVNIPDFDKPLQRAGGQSNAFTSNDITNYYNLLPADNLETALWLESDRLLSLAFTHESLEVQRNVVIEEFKQRYLNQPYGDVWLTFRPMAYKIHPYQWPTIGKSIQHIEDASMQDVKSFFKKHYTPQNAILCIAGNFKLNTIKKLVEKYYADIPSGNKYIRNLPEEPTQNEYRTQLIERNVPNNAFYYGFKMPAKYQKGYFSADILSDLIGRGKSSRLYLKLKKELGLVTEINAYILGSHDTGLLIIAGYLTNESSFEDVETALWEVLDDIKKNDIPDSELTKTINKFKTTKVFSEQGSLSKAILLCNFELFGDANDINKELLAYEKLTPSIIRKQANKILVKENCSRLTIKAIKDAR